MVEAIEYVLSLRIKGESEDVERLFGALSAPDDGDAWINREVRSCS